jgi:hypothetical protein
MKKIFGGGPLKQPIPQINCNYWYRLVKWNAKNNYCIGPLKQPIPIIGPIIHIG